MIESALAAEMGVYTRIEGQFVDVMVERFGAGVNRRGGGQMRVYTRIEGRLLEVWVGGFEGVGRRVGVGGALG
jgi:hypothetical protein